MGLRGYVYGQPDWRRVSVAAKAPIGLRGYAYGQPDWRRVTVNAWLTWGAVGGTTAGELLQVAYSVTHPAVTGATLVLADGRRLAMTVYPDRLELLLPEDTPDGPATVIAELD